MQSAAQNNQKISGKTTLAQNYQLNAVYYQCHTLLAALMAFLPKTTSSLLYYEKYNALPISLYGHSD
jgi:hypothetical protein